MYVITGLVAAHAEPWTYRDLAGRLGVPVPLVQRSLKRCEAVELYRPTVREVHLPNLEELLLHAIRFIAPVQLGELVSGVPAAWAAEPMAGRIVQAGSEPPPVWPAATGTVRGQALRPLHQAAVSAAARDPRLAAWLSVVDSLRAGDRRVSSVAADLAGEWIREAARAR